MITLSYCQMMPLSGLYEIHERPVLIDHEHAVQVIYQSSLEWVSFKP